MDGNFPANGICWTMHSSASCHCRCWWPGVGRFLLAVGRQLNSMALVRRSDSQILQGYLDLQVNFD